MKIIHNTQAIFHQIIHLLKNIPENDYAKPLDIINNASLGMQFRHIVEFYVQIEKGYTTREICYDNRERDKCLETQIPYLISKMEDLLIFLDYCNSNALININANYGDENDYSDTYQSSIGRELAYALDHAIHHLAIIKIAIQSDLPYISIPENLGMAPSTIRNKETACAQ